jgi:thioredoxin-related protein
MKFNINNLFKSKNPYYKLLIVLIICLLVIFFINALKIHNIMNINFGVENFENDGTKKLVYYYWEDCGHCKKFMDKWDEFCVQNAENSNPVQTLKIEKSDAGADLDKYNVQGYPTIILIDGQGNKIKEFTEHRSVENLLAFVNAN